MADAEKVYRPHPRDLPTYDQATSEELRRITQNHSWNYSLFDCYLTSCCLPCLAFGKTQSRLRDPTLQSYDSINGDYYQDPEKGSSKAPPLDLSADGGLNGSRIVRGTAIENANFDTAGLSHDEYLSLFNLAVHNLAVQEYIDFTNAADPSSMDFRKAMFPDVQQFDRFFESPGLEHRSGEKGGQPTTVFHALRSWVGNGTAPDTLPVEFSGGNGTPYIRNLCPYPAQAKYIGGDVSSANSYRCE
ncbi:feruloyl esterase [Aspergillus luchuensis]|uniref:Carboxylic ester hydrolase n=1 Tax=Aspergillus kawachii TaxID=1069201 RepID=A0A146G066_ASPKA|nr:feruloyl esterase [Aspergillus luchuensis]